MGVLDTVLGSSGRAQIGKLVLDVSISENHNREAEITEHPVQDGSEIADHYIPKRWDLTIEGEISNTPLLTGFPGATAVSAVKSIIKGDTNTPVELARIELNRVMDSKERIKIITSLQTLDNMLIKSLSIVRSAQKANCLRFTATVKQIKIVINQTTGAITIPKDKTKASKKDKGKQGTQETAEKKSSGLVKLLQGAGVVG